MCLDHPLLHFPGPDGLEHTVWRVTDDEDTTDLAAALGDAVHYIADGHHRVAARLLAWERAGRPDDAGVLCMLFPMDGLTMSAFHRRVRGPVDAASLIDAASLHFLVRRVPTADLTTEIGLYVAGCWYDLTPTDVRPEGAAGLDASLLHDRLLGPALGISGDGHPRLEALPDHVPLEQSDGEVRRGQRRAVRPATSLTPQAHPDRRPRRADAAQDHLLHAQALRGDLPHLTWHDAGSL